jgi:short-subunit dehydrogenase
MNVQLKPLQQQVMVITGASSGIGLATAEAAAKKGVKLVLAARSDETLKTLADRITSEGGEAIAVHCDVADKADVARLAQAANDRFGRIDTWINNAGLGMHGRLDEIDTEDGKRLFDINFWGVVYGSLAALPYLKKEGGALINVGSEVSEASAPLLGIYTASKHAVKGFTDSLRIEIENVDKAPVSITLIQPTAVDTPFPEHSRNFMSQEPKLPTPMIDPSQVATAILKAAVKPTRSKKVGTKALMNTMVATMLPFVGDTLAAREVNRQQYDEPPRNASGILRHSSESCHSAGRTHGAGGNKSA